jgi:hypothetical protein
VSSCWSWRRCVSSRSCGCCRRRRSSCDCWSRRRCCCRRCCNCSRRAWRWSWAGGRDINITLSASRGTTRAVTEILSKKRVVSLHSGCGRCVATRHRTPDHIKAILSLIQPQFVVSRRGRSSEINSAPFDIEDSVRRGARHRGEDTAGATRESRAAALRIGALVIPVREDRVVVTGPRQRADIGKRRVGSRELRIAVG